MALIGSLMTLRWAEDIYHPEIEIHLSKRHAHLEVDDRLISWAMVVFIFLFMFSFGVAISSFPWVLMGKNLNF